jgi:hypothetical protein
VVPSYQTIEINCLKPSYISKLKLTLFYICVCVCVCVGGWVCMYVCMYVYIYVCMYMYEGVSKSCRTGRLERELQMVQLSATRCSCFAISWISLVSFAARTLCVSSQQVFNFCYFAIDSVRKLLDTPSYVFMHVCVCVCVCMYVFVWGYV